MNIVPRERLNEFLPLYLRDEPMMGYSGLMPKSRNINILFHVEIKKNLSPKSFPEIM